MLIKPCEKLPELVVEEMQMLVHEQCESKVMKRKMTLLDNTTKPTSSKVSAGTQQCLPAMFNNKKAVDESVARAFYSAGIPFAVASNYYFKQALADVSKFGPGYTPPSEFTLRTSLLKDKVKKVGNEIKPLINYILVCTKGDVFLYIAQIHQARIYPATSSQKKLSNKLLLLVQRSLYR
jgi:hypothetical protein